MKDLWRLLRLFRPYAGWMALGIVLSFITLVANLTLMAVSGWFIASMAIAGAAGVSMNYFTPAAIIRACAIARTLGRYGERLVTHEATLRLLSTLRVWFYERLEPLAPARLQLYRSGDLLSRIRADIDTLDNFYLRTLVPTLTAALASLAFLLFLWRYDSALALILLGLLLLGGVGVPWVVRSLGEGPGRQVVALKSELRAATVDGVQGLAELQAYGADPAQANHINDLSRRLGREQQRLSGLTGLSQGALGLTANLALWLTVWTAIPLVRDGSIAPPDLVMLALFALAAFEAVAPLPAAFQSLGETRAATRRVLEILEAEPLVTEPSIPAPPPQGFAITFEGVSFTYPGAPRPALSGIDLQWSEGAKIALLGPTGSGKTTLVNLLLRFWSPDHGCITLGGTDIADLGGEEVRRHIAVVSQHTHLFSGTIRDNLLLADPSASQQRLEQVCRSAELHGFISAQPEGYATQVGEGGIALSGGQARRLAIARALLKDAPVLILDEPTEGLDGPTAQALMETLNRLMTGRRVLLITHRREGLKHMDQVWVLDEGSLNREGVRGEIAEHQ
ncbi:MAG: thiol reductant ABC exporter subunit CydC [Bdellovibrio bacteriovorus]